MTKFNQALIAGASSIALVAGAMTLITPAANAGMRCSTSSYTGRTSCYGSGGTFRSTYNSYTGVSTYSGRDNNGNYYSGRCSTSSYTGITTCN
jgi:hypothetical protein